MVDELYMDHPECTMLGTECVLSERKLLSSPSSAPLPHSRSQPDAEEQLGFRFDGTVRMDGCTPGFGGLGV